MPLPAIAAGGFLAQVLGYVFAFAISKVVVKLVTALGVGYVTYVGFSSLIDMVQGYIDSNLGGLPANVFQVINIVNVPAAINLILSAYAARYTLFTLSKRLVFNPPGTV